MNVKALLFLKNISYTMTSQFISLAISTLFILIIPKFIGVEEYGYLQLYVFYAAYVGFFLFGWNDGIYLRYGGKEYSELDKQELFSQFYMVAILQLAVASILLCASFLCSNEEKAFIFQMVCINLVLFNLRGFLLFILQCTNRIKAYSRIIMIDRIVFACLTLAILFLGVRNYKVIILIDLFARLFTLLIAMYCCKEIVFRHYSEFSLNFSEATKNISIGSKIMLANISGMLIVGVVRIGIEHTWGIETFGKVALALSVSSLMMLFMNAFSVVFFPVLKRVDRDDFRDIYLIARDLLMVILLGVILLFFPLESILSTWLPEYEESFRYMVLLFPICIFDGKMSIIINTYFKALREEKKILNINFTTLLISIISTFLIIKVFNNVELLIVSIVVLLAFRSIMAERYLSTILDINVKKDTLLECTMACIFILSGYFLEGHVAFFIYLMSYLIYLIARRKRIWNSFKLIKHHMKSAG